MITLLQDAKMVTDLDAGDKVLKTVGKLLPVPNTMVDTDDPRMSDGREILDGTVTDLSVAATAAIEQSKLSLDGNIPTSWLGSDEKTAARGDLVERVASKGAIGGYAALGVSAKLSAGNLPTTGPQLGTVTKVGLSMPGHFAVVTSGSVGVIDSYSEVNADSWAKLDGLPALAYGQCFTGDGKKITTAKWYLSPHNFPIGNAVAKIYAMTGTFGTNGVPGTLLGTSDPFDVSTLVGPTLISFNFSGAEQFQTVNGTHYVVTCEYGGDAVKWIELGYDSTGTHPGNWAYKNGGWNPMTGGISLCFYVVGVSPGSGNDSITGSGEFVVTWNDAPNNSFLGASGSLPAQPDFVTNLPEDAIPDLDAAKFSGEFVLERLPVAVGLGVDHAVGVVPDTGEVGNVSDYLGRDMTWRTITLNISYQPTLPDVQLTVIGWFNGQAQIKVYQPQAGSALFYQFQPLFTNIFIPIANPSTILVPVGIVINAYAAKAGWNNSRMSVLKAPGVQEVTI